MIPVDKEATDKTPMPSIVKRLRDDSSAPRANLACASRINPDHQPTSAFSLVADHPSQSSQSRVAKVPSQTSTLGVLRSEVDQLLDVQVFDADHVVFVYQLSRYLMKLIPTCSVEILISTSEDLDSFPPAIGSLPTTRHDPLLASQLFLSSLKRLKISQDFTLRSHDQVLKAKIDTNHLACSWQRIRSFDLATQDRVPAISFVFDRDRFDTAHAFEGCWRSPSYPTEAGDVEVRLLPLCTFSLWMGEGMISLCWFEARVSGFLTFYNPSEEGFEGKIYPFTNILEHGRVYVLVIKALSTKIWKLILLIVLVNRLSLSLPSLSSLLKAGVVELLTEGKPATQPSFLSLVGIEFEFVRSAKHHY